MNKKKLKDYIKFESDLIDKEHFLRHKKIKKPKRPKIKLNANTTKRLKTIIDITITVLFIFIMLLTTSKLPTFGSANQPSVNEVTSRYIEQGVYETGSINVVTGMILDYRAFDTFGESTVLFLALICVVVLLKKDKINYGYLEEHELKEDDMIIKGTGNTIMRETVRYVFPFIILFGIYIILNGHLSPGGGFSGGAIIGAGLIMYSTAFGYQAVEKFLSFKKLVSISTGCLLTYFALKAYSFFTAANELPSIIGPGKIGNILSAGLILPLNICVGIIVSLTMYGFYALFTRGDI